MSHYGYQPTYGQPQPPYQQHYAPQYLPQHYQQPYYAPPPHMQQPVAPPQPAPAPAPQPQGSGVPYIGALISLVSKMNLRYEGTLYTIDAKNSTVALKDVRCFGTEDRVDESGFVPPSPSIYEFIVFSGRDIKDLHVIETIKQKETASAEQPPAQQPVLQHQQQQRPSQSQQQQASQPHEEKAPEPADELESAVSSLALSDSRSPASQTHTRSPSRGGRGRGGHHQQSQQPRYTVSILEPRILEPHDQQQQQHHRQQRRHHTHTNTNIPRQPQQNNEEILSREFDFESSNARFNKDEFIHAQVDNGPRVDAPVYDLPVADDRQEEAQSFAAVTGSADRPAIGVKYDKSKSFFDDLGSDRNGGALHGRRANPQVDRETFGDAAVRGSHHGRRGGGGYHRGGHRGGRGGGGFHRGGGGGGGGYHRGGQRRQGWADLAAGGPGNSNANY